MIVLTFVLLLLAFFLEGTVVALPLVFAVVVALHISFRQPWILVFAFFSGMLLDLMLFRVFGQTSLFLLSFLLLLVIYERKFETRTYPFVLFSSLLGGASYLLLFGSVNFFVQLAFLVFLTVTLFVLFQQSSSAKFLQQS